MIKLIKKSEAKVVDLGTKVITKYTADDKQLEINHMTIRGRHPENPDHFIYEEGVRFMVYITSGKAKITCDDQVFEVEPGDAVDVPVITKYAVECLTEAVEYITAESPAFYPEQAFIVDRQGNIVEDTKE